MGEEMPVEEKKKEEENGKWENHPRKASIQAMIVINEANKTGTSVVESWEQRIKQFQGNVLFWEQNLMALQVGDAPEQSIYYQEAKRELQSAQAGLRGAEEMLGLSKYVIEQERLKKALADIKK